MKRKAQREAMERPGPRMMNVEAMLGIDGKPRGSVDSGSSRGLLEEYGQDKPDTPAFVGRTMRGQRG
jgi:hypothetical protein